MSKTGVANPRNIKRSSAKRSKQVKIKGLFQLFYLMDQYGKRQQTLRRVMGMYKAKKTVYIRGNYQSNDPQNSRQPLPALFLTEG